MDLRPRKPPAWNYRNTEANIWVQWALGRGVRRWNRNLDRDLRLRRRRLDNAPSQRPEFNARALEQFAAIRDTHWRRRWREIRPVGHEYMRAEGPVSAVKYPVIIAALLVACIAPSSAVNYSLVGSWNCAYIDTSPRPDIIPSFTYTGPFLFTADGRETWRLYGISLTGESIAMYDLAGRLYRNYLIRFRTSGSHDILRVNVYRFSSGSSDGCQDPSL